MEKYSRFQEDMKSKSVRIKELETTIEAVKQALENEKTRYLTATQEGASNETLASIQKNIEEVERRLGDYQSQMSSLQARVSLYEAADIIQEESLKDWHPPEGKAPH